MPHDDVVTLCNNCGHDFEANGRLSVPKFSGTNWVNKSLCQHQPSVFDDLILVEKQAGTILSDTLLATVELEATLLPSNKIPPTLTSILIGILL